MAEFQRFLDECNAHLAYQQSALRKAAEAWGALVIQNGLNADQALRPGAAIQPNTIVVGVARADLVGQVEIHPGDNAELDLLAEDVLIHVLATEDSIHRQFP